MKIRGWIIAVAMVLSAQCAFAASNSDSIATLDPEQAVNPAVVQTVVADLIDNGMDAAVAQAQIAEASGGTLVNVVRQLKKDNTVAETALRTLWDDVVIKGSGAGAMVMAGSNNVAGAEAATATTMAIGGSGGVIAGRQAGLMAERKAMGNVDSALASFKMNQSFANRIWASPFYTRQENDKAGSGYDYSAWGASVGYDHAFGSFVAGGAFTYSRGDFDADGLVDDNTIDNYGFSLYGQYYCVENGFFATITGGYNYGDNDLRSVVGNQTFASEYGADSFWFGGNIGKDFFLGENWTITPTVGLFWSSSETDRYTERVNNAPVRDWEIENESLVLPIDLKAEYTTLIDDCSSLSFNVAGGYAYNFKDGGGRAEGNYTVVGTNITGAFLGPKSSRSSWNIGTGVTYRRNNFDLGVNYRYDGKSDFSGHRLSATIGWNF